jgi:hypothetical protein
LIPEFVELIRNVKKDKVFSLREIARKHWLFILNIFIYLLMNLKKMKLNKQCTKYNLFVFLKIESFIFCLI